MRTTQPLVVGFDLSLNGTGIAYVDGACSTVKCGPHQGDDRLGIIRAACYRAIDPLRVGKVAVAVIEGPILHGPGPQAMFGIGMVHGAVRHMLNRRGIPYVTVNPSTLKLHATGSGRADKDQMAAALVRDHHVELGDDNQVDAWWLRHMGLCAFEQAALPRDLTERALTDWLRNIRYTPAQPTLEGTTTP